MDIDSVFQAIASRRTVHLSDVDSDVVSNLSTYGLEFEDGVLRLPGETELLSTEFIQQHIDETVRSQVTSIEVLPSVGSTNSMLIDSASLGSIDGKVLLAEVQTGGRGRRGRSWYTPFGRNIALSVGVRLNRDPQSVGALSLAIGLAVVGALKRIGISHAQVKWPNDVVVDGGKICGILVELIHGRRPVDVVIGVGINVGARSSVESIVDREIADVVDYVATPVRNQLTGLLVGEILAACRRYEVHGFGGFQRDWESLDMLRDRTIAVETAGNLVVGTAKGIAEDGALLVEAEGRLRRFIGGEISIRPRE